ncbi:MAG TPA: uracil-DNA glycosylase [Rhizomicrobium sp.]|nr:uracil-DNA glycosylase [Rhizomicrobium sp.]
MRTTDADHLAALAWLVDAGADEAVLDEPVNRFAAPKPVRESQCAEVPQPTPTQVREQLRPRAPEPLPAASDDAIGSAMEIAARAQTLAELKAALEGYDGCALKQLATNTVFADGTPDHGIMLIGEAPGHDEDRQGLPFVGRAGKLLDKMLAAVHLDRTKVYIVNVLPWRPPDNRNPEPTEVAKCIPFLRRHIELARPKILILLGAVSARHVLGQTDGIMRLRGKWLEYHVAGHMIPVMPTLHPAYLLRRPIDKRLAWRDLQAIAARVKTFS